MRRNYISFIIGGIQYFYYPLPFWEYRCRFGKKMSAMPSCNIRISKISLSKYNIFKIASYIIINENDKGKGTMSAGVYNSIIVRKNV